MNRKSSYVYIFKSQDDHNIGVYPEFDVKHGNPLFFYYHKPKNPETYASSLLKSRNIAVRIYSPVVSPLLKLLFPVKGD